ncbi:MAG TPA: hypothetical protein VFD43_11085 [Planctomycetota bacterium]|nr:hypothetical protein [Planctomycetota bacterium]
MLCAALGFALVDAGVGWLDRRQAPADEGLYLKDPALGFTNRPHFRNEATHLDRYGLRNEEIPGDVPADELRILGLGASLTYGAGGPRQEQTWSYALEARLDAVDGGPPVRVLNGGVMGYSLLQACRRGLALLPLVDPDLVIVFVSPGRQSLISRSGALRWERVGDEYVPVDVVQGLPAALRPLAATLHGWMNKSALYRRQRTLLLEPGQRDTSWGKYTLSRAAPPPGFEELLQRGFDEATALVEAAQARGAQVRFLLYPEWEQCGDAVWTRFLQAQAGRGAPPLGTPRTEPMEVLAERLQAEGGRCWSLFELISGFARRPDEYILPNDHWTPAGHAAVAGAIAELIEGEGLLPELAAVRARRPR